MEEQEATPQEEAETMVQPEPEPSEDGLGSPVTLGR